MNSTTRKIGAAFGLASIAAFSVALPAAATPTTEWAQWVNNGDNFAFTNSSLVGGYLNWGGMNGNWIISTDTDGEYFTADTPIGAIFGSNGPSSTETYFKFQTQNDTSSSTFVELVFDAPVPANLVAFAISDIDTDHVVVAVLAAAAAAAAAAAVAGRRRV